MVKSTKKRISREMVYFALVCLWLARYKSCICYLCVACDLYLVESLFYCIRIACGLHLVQCFLFFELHVALRNPDFLFLFCMRPTPYAILLLSCGISLPWYVHYMWFEPCEILLYYLYIACYSKQSLDINGNDSSSPD